MKPISHLPELAGEPRRLVEFAEWLGSLLERAGGEVTDLGYAFRSQQAELVVQAPDGTRVELDIRRL